MKCILRLLIILMLVVSNASASVDSVDYEKFREYMSYYDISPIDAKEFEECEKLLMCLENTSLETGKFKYVTRDNTSYVEATPYFVIIFGWVGLDDYDKEGSQYRIYKNVVYFSDLQMESYGKPYKTFGWLDEDGRLIDETIYSLDRGMLGVSSLLLKQYGGNEEEQ